MRALSHRRLVVAGAFAAAVLLLPAGAALAGDYGGDGLELEVEREQEAEAYIGVHSESNTGRNNAFADTLQGNRIDQLALSLARGGFAMCGLEVESEAENEVEADLGNGAEGMAGVMTGGAAAANEVGVGVGQADEGDVRIAVVDLPEFLPMPNAELRSDHGRCCGGDEGLELEVEIEQEAEVTIEASANANSGGNHAGTLTVQHNGVSQAAVSEAEGGLVIGGLEVESEAENEVSGSMMNEATSTAIVETGDATATNGVSTEITQSSTGSVEILVVE
jgi:hypothetical protein